MRSEDIGELLAILDSDQVDWKKIGEVYHWFMRGPAAGRQRGELLISLVAAFRSGWHGLLIHPLVQEDPAKARELLDEYGLSTFSRTLEAAMRAVSDYDSGAGATVLFEEFDDETETMRSVPRTFLDALASGHNVNSDIAQGATAFRAHCRTLDAIFRDHGIDTYENLCATFIRELSSELRRRVAGG